MMTLLYYWYEFRSSNKLVSINVFIVLAGLAGLSGPLFSAPFYAFIQTEIEPHILGRVFSLLTGLSLLVTPNGYAVAGLLIELTGVAALLSIMGVLIGRNRRRNTMQFLLFFWCGLDLEARIDRELSIRNHYISGGS